MTSVEKILAKMRRGSKNIRFEDALKVCEFYFGAPIHNEGSHVKFKVPWRGPPKVNIQSDSGQLKDYQRKQLLEAIDLKERLGGEKSTHPSTC